MRILRIIRSADSSGGGPIEGIIQSSKILKELGHSVEIVSLDSPNKPWLRNISIEIHAMGPGIGKYSYSPRYTVWLKQHAERFDVALIHGIWQYSSFGAWLVLHKKKIPYFVFPHGMLDPWFKYTYPLKHIKKYLYWPWAEYRVLRDARAVLFTSEQERILARESFAPYECKEEVVNYGTSLPPQDRENKRKIFFDKFPELENKQLILFLGRIHPKKGCDLLIEAFAQICKNRPLIHLVMAGPDQIGWQSTLQKLCKRLGINDRITWAGMLLDDLKWGAFYAADAFILPSHQENFGMAVIEALGCSLPVLISDKVNIWREIETDHACFIANDTLEGTVELLKKWMGLLYDEKQNMRNNAKQCFLKRFEIHNAVQSLIDTLRANGVKG